MDTLRKTASRVVIAAFSVAALLGIVALLTGEFGETQGKILLTTVVVGLESLAILCYLAPTRSPWTALGVLGFLVSLVTFTLALVLVWGPTDEAPADWFTKTLFVSLTLAATLAQVCLLIGLTGDRRRSRTYLLVATCVAAAVVAALVVWSILDPKDDVAWFWRTFGVVAILDALGSVVLIALRVFAGGDEGRARLTKELEARLAAAARERGVTQQEVLEAAVEGYVRLGSAERP